MPDWLSGQAAPLPSRSAGNVGRRSHLRERFLERTLHHAVSFVEDVVFNEVLSSRKGLLQAIEPRLKAVTIFAFIAALSFQKSVAGLVPFLLLCLVLVPASGIPVPFFVRKLVPVAAMTAIIALPAALNLFVDGNPILVLWGFGEEISLGPLALPRELTITEQGSLSAATLILRVVASVSYVFLLTMTTPPNGLMRGMSYFFPGFLKSVFSISYRYIFFLVRKIEQSVMGLRSRTLSGISASGGRRWAASRIGFLFSISMDLSKELGAAMESRGYGEEKYEAGAGKSAITERDVVWLVFTVLFCGAMIWKSFT